MSFKVHIVLVPDDNDFGQFFSERHVSLAALPRVGEYLTNDDQEGIGHAFKVVAVIHPVNPGAGTAAVEIRAARIGTALDLFKILEKKNGRMK